MRSMAVQNGKPILHMGVETGTGGPNGGPLRERHDI